MDIREAVKCAMVWGGKTETGYRRRAKVVPMTANRLATLAKIPSRTVYDFIEGKGPINSDALGRVLDVLNLRLVSTSDLQCKVCQKRKSEIEGADRLREEQAQEDAQVIIPDADE